MNLKNNKGYSGVDVSVAVIIIMLFIPTIFGMIYNINKSKANVTREGYATQIATEIIGMAKSTEFENIDSGFGQNILNSGDTKYFFNKMKNKYGQPINMDASFFNQDTGFAFNYFNAQGKNGEKYTIQVGVQNYYPEEFEQSETKPDLIKKIKVAVAYTVGSKIEQTELIAIVENEKYSRKEILYNEI